LDGFTDGPFLSKARINITLDTSNDEGAGTEANFYMTLYDSTGAKDTVSLPKPLEAGSTVNVERAFVNLQDLDRIALRTFSIDGWKMESIQIAMMGSTYLFTNQNGETIDKYSGEVSFNPA